MNTPSQEDDVTAIVDEKTDINPNADKIPTTPDNTTATCSENIDCQKSEFCYIKTKWEKGTCIKKWDEEGNKVSTEELTKELDAFVDDITKWL